MDSTAVTWTIGGVATAVTTVAGIIGGRMISRNASGVTQNVDPNERLVQVVADMSERLTRSERDHSRAKADIADLKADLDDERRRSDRQDDEISSLRDENRDLRTQLNLVQRAVAAWETWHRWLVSHWPTIRQDATPPDGPQLAPETD